MNKQNTSDYKEIVEQLQNGNRDAFESLVDMFTVKVAKQVWMILGNHADTEDIIQEVFFKVYRSISSYKGRGFTSWVSTITRNICIDKLRKDQKTVSLEEELLVKESCQIAGVSLQEELSILESLSLHDRYLVYLKLVEGYSYKDLAKITGMAEGTLRNTVSRSIKRLRREQCEICNAKNV